MRCEAKPLFEATGRFWPSHWSRDGRYLVYTEVGSQINLFALPFRGDRKPIEVAQSEFGEGVGTLSPDGAGRRAFLHRRETVATKRGKSPLKRADGGVREGAVVNRSQKNRPTGNQAP